MNSDSTVWKKLFNLLLIASLVYAAGFLIWSFATFRTVELEAGESSTSPVDRGSTLESVPAGVWSSLGGPVGGPVEALYVSERADGGRVFYAIGGGGVFRAWDEPRRWTLLTGGFGTLFVRSLHVVPREGKGQRLYLATNERLWLSDDAGDRWKDITPKPLQGNIRSVKVTPTARGERVFATSSESLLEYVGANGRWRRLAHELASATPFHDLGYLDGPDGDLALWLATAKGLFWSPADGDHWSPVRGFKKRNVFRILEPANDCPCPVAYLTTMYRSWVFWRRMALFELDHDGDRRRRLLRNTRVAILPVTTRSHGEPAPAGTLAAVTAKGTLVVSEDGGRTWRHLVADDLKLQPVVALSPDYGSNGLLYSVAGDGRVLEIDSRRHSWTVHGRGPWTVRVNGIAMSPRFQADRTIFAATGAGLAITTDGGREWRMATTEPVRFVVVAPDFARTGTVYIGGDDGIRTGKPDSGWETLGEGLEGEGANALLFSPTFDDDRVLWAGTDEGLFVSRDAGGSWQRSREGIGDVQVNCIAAAVVPYSGPVLYAGTLDGLYSSADGGQSWTRAHGRVGATNVLALAVAEQTANEPTLLAGTAEGIFVSEDLGAIWRRRELGDSAFSVSSLLVVPARGSDTLYAATIGGGVYRSTDRGRTWLRMPSDNLNPLISDLAFGGGDPPTLVAATLNRGVEGYREVPAADAP